MPRRNRAAPPPSRAVGGARPTRTETWRGVEFAVRPVAGDREYRCPGCDQLIRTGLPHVVSWDAAGDGEDRRHWHTACWAARERRGTGVQRSRSAPRY